MPTRKKDGDKPDVVAMGILDSLKSYPSVLKHLGQSWAEESAKGKPLSHPLGKRLQAGEQFLFHLEDLECLLKTAEDVQGFAKLIRKLKAAGNAHEYFDYIHELHTCNLFLAAGYRNINLGLEDQLHKRPDMWVQVGGHPLNVEVTRIHALTPRQAKYEERINRLAKKVSQIPSPFYVGFHPWEEYGDDQIEIVARIIEQKIQEYLASGLSKPLESYLNSGPHFTMHTSRKGPLFAGKPETIFRVGSIQVFLTGEGKEEQKIQDVLPRKYRKFRQGELNLLVTWLSSDPLEEAAQNIEDILQEERPNLGAVVLASSWSGRSKVFKNPKAETQLPAAVLQVIGQLWPRT